MSPAKAKAAPKKKPAKKKSDYGAKQITVLEGLDPVRKRPGMYIGSTGPDGLHHLIWEVVDNGIDEAMAGHASHVQITLRADGFVEVSDDGRGIPVDKHPQAKVSALEVVMTKLHAGGKFGQGAYKVSGGLHGVGVSVVNALSTDMKATVHRDGKVWEQEYKIGKPQKKVRPVGTTRKTGTTIAFKPDDSIFETTDFSWDVILTHFRQQAYLTKGVKISVFDEREKGKHNAYCFYFEGGAAAYVRHINRHKQPKHQNVFYIEKEAAVEDGSQELPIKVEVALQYTSEYKESVFGFANNIPNPEGGTHVAGFRTALTRTLNSYARKKNILKEKDDNLSGEDVREGLTSVVSVKVGEPQFEGQTKAKLGNTEARPAVDGVFSEAFGIYLEEHPKDAEAILGQCILAQRARKAAKVARESVLRKGALEGLTLPGKLADCSSRKAEKCELFIVEGDSAGGSGKQGRDRETQAILPLRGKILNTERARIDKLLANTELKSMIIALGTNFGEQFQIEKLRYGKIVIMTDADSDGAHIRTLLLTFFFRYFRELIQAGHLYVAQPPLYRIAKGKQIQYAYTEDEKLKMLAAMEKGTKKDSVSAKVSADTLSDDKVDETGVGETTIAGVNIQRYKGLGEMNPEQLWETTMDPETRTLNQVTIKDAEKADEVFDLLMGAEVAPRKNFIQTHAKSVAYLDV